MRELLRGAVRLHILHHASQGTINGAWMSEELAHHGYPISPGSLYPTLHQMQGDGLLVSHVETVEGHNRRVYTATAKGPQALVEARQQLRELATEVLGEDWR